MRSTIQELISRLEHRILDADLSGMLDAIGELSGIWSELDDTTRAHVLKLQAIFLTLLSARTRGSPPTSPDDIVGLDDRPAREGRPH